MGEFLATVAAAGLMAFGTHQFVQHSDVDGSLREPAAGVVSVWFHNGNAQGARFDSALDDLNDDLERLYLSSKSSKRR